MQQIINTPQQPNYEQPQPISERKGINWASITVISSIIILILIVAVLAYWFVYLRPLAESSDTKIANDGEKVTNPADDKQNTDQNNQDETNIYRNLELGFELTYSPPVNTDFIAKSPKSGDNILGIKGPNYTEGSEFSDGLAIFVKDLPFEGTLRGTAVADRDSILEAELSLIGTEALGATFETDHTSAGEETAVLQTVEPPYGQFYYIQTEDKVIRIHGLYPGEKSKEYKEIFTQLVATFRFTGK